ncbi:hypothetical protein Vadar_029555 [Vaccinium darrowii]|uniref:Uncharacterized protein n=1 Tax=Vaccinium darrowii TaxID=229202 RepID=A0ACB7X4X1_9ERIC|nr:hypothetical protein Vadar_029555 [Vaccinium darrowii]
MDSDRLDLISLFVDNLPEDVGINWFRKFFSQYGVVKDAYIPFKRSKVSKRRFGFVRYNCLSSAEVAISKANGFWIDNRKLFVKMAAFEAQGLKTGFNGEKHDFLLGSRSVVPLMKYGSNIPEKSWGLHEDRPSYAQVTRGVEGIGENLATRSVQKVESSKVPPDFDALCVHDDKLSHDPKEALSLDLGSKVDPIDNGSRSSQGLVSLVEDSMGLQYPFHEAFEDEPVDLDALAVVAYVRLWRVGTSVTGDVEPWADGAIRPYAERVRDCYVSAFEWAAGLGDEEAGVGYRGDVGSCVFCSCGLCS